MKISFKKHILIILLITVLLGFFFSVGLVISYTRGINDSINTSYTKMTELNTTQKNTNNKLTNSNIKELDNIIEENVRNQMRLNLSSVGEMFLSEIQNRDVKSKDELIRSIKDLSGKLVSTQRIFNTEGDWFVLLTVGPYTYYIKDFSTVSNQPNVNGTSIVMNTETRVRTVYDEVIWQAEASYVLFKYGLINRPIYSNCKYNDVDLKISNTYKHDDYLENIEIYRVKDVEYIQNKYPDVYNKMRFYRIIMHSDIHKAEEIMQFLEYNKSTSKGDNLYWYPYTKGNKEILEVYVVPPGVLGFNSEPRMKGASIYNDNYVKISIVAACPINEYMRNYDDIKTKLQLNTSESDIILKNYHNTIITVQNYLKIFSVIISVVLCGSILFAIVAYLKIPRHIITSESFQHLCSNYCPNNKTHNNAEEGIDSNRVHKT